MKGFTTRVVHGDRGDVGGDGLPQKPVRATLARATDAALTALEKSWNWRVSWQWINQSLLRINSS
ncbi:MAG: hypothetical protein O7E57_08300 [Gammaproteobacteria bacterium]|nr:hypothetical protein [Gammaproteobacteria bacterium]